ncbi:MULTISPECIES: hypothetical protein [Bradyrhizobium]|jgi:hypothetical protein|uniref:Uncharacterized protein n=2 Tax=Nitrobacteraceae TaxID=41294 RepID=A0ABS5GBN1_9BRAD|nr:MULTISPECIES: hypothetical protein [Bradyrhizobium]RTM05551.1 MAG: hypothetical protein EKK32_03065 [Bradyrhizobiaceae bacterium]MBR1138444.1 hypothetical protein [Bradyrhizobium denitrificans]MCL8485497.1 hypothetical protein [Bradyrhizobium denitrificans]MDU3127342.1 hypothetical protein [Bradyrhizobium sp.]MDU6319242.1 hypothetical protein [Bradyrhizobium sp.]
MAINGLLKVLCAPALVFLAGQAWAGTCVNPPLSPEAIAQFKADPKAIVAPDTDTRTVENLVRDLVGTDAKLAADIIQIARDTTPRFRSAIAAGMAQGAIACSNVDQEAALLIQQAVASFEDSAFQASFAAVAGDLSTAAVEAAAASATASVGSVVIVTPGTARGRTTQPGGGGSTAIAQITSVGTIIRAISGTNSTSSTAASPVSAKR